MGGLIRMKKRCMALLPALIVALLLCACGLNTDNDVTDYFGECTFALPFRATYTPSEGNVRFDVSMTLAQVCEAIVGRGYRAELFEKGPEDTLLITAIRNEKTYYFVIFDQDLAAEGDDYVLAPATLSWRVEENVYSILAPIHLMDPDADTLMTEAAAGDGRMRVYASFDYIAQFYRAADREGIVIDQTTETITFPVQADETTGRTDSIVTLRYVGSDGKQYLEITARPVSPTDTAEA